MRSPPPSPSRAIRRPRAPSPTARNSSGTSTRPPPASCEVCLGYRIVRYLKIVISDSETIRGFRGTKRQRCTVLPFRATSPVVKYDLIGVHHGMRLRPVCQSWRCGSTIVLDNPVVLRISFTPPEGSLRARCGPACEWDAAQEARRVATPMRVQLPRNGIMRALYRRICTAGGDWALIGDVGMRLVAITVREKRLCEKWEPHDMNGVPMKHDGADAPRGACAIIRMVRVRSASGREGLVVRLGV